MNPAWPQNRPDTVSLALHWRTIKPRLTLARTNPPGANCSIQAARIRSTPQVAMIRSKGACSAAPWAPLPVSTVTGYPALSSTAFAV
jgi:hypothetical protein